MKILVRSTEEAIDIARIIQQAASSVQHDPTRNDLENVTLTQKLCALRDNIEVGTGEIESFEDYRRRLGRSG